MNFNVAKVVFLLFFFFGLCFPFSFGEKNKSFDFLGYSWALSSESMPLPGYPNKDK